MDTDMQVWKPTVTVAAIVERDGRFLLVEEQSARGAVYNQPAGHLEPGESLLEGAAREALEETGYSMAPTALLGVYHLHDPRTDVTYLRFAFVARIVAHHAERKLDEGIIGCAWMTLEEIRGTRERHRSPLVSRCVEDYVAGKRYPLDVLVRHG